MYILSTEMGNKQDYISCCDSKFHAIRQSSDNSVLPAVPLQHRVLLRPVKITTTCIPSIYLYILATPFVSVG